MFRASTETKKCKCTNWRRRAEPLSHFWLRLIAEASCCCCCCGAWNSGRLVVDSRQRKFGIRLPAWLGLWSNGIRMGDGRKVVSWGVSVVVVYLLVAYLLPAVLGVLGGFWGWHKDTLNTQLEVSRTYSKGTTDTFLEWSTCRVGWRRIELSSKTGYVAGQSFVGDKVWVETITKVYVWGFLEVCSKYIETAINGKATPLCLANKI